MCSAFNDGCPRNAHEWARLIVERNDFGSVAEVGCGAASCLTKYFFDKHIVGYETGISLEKLHLQYPFNCWIELTPDSLAAIDTDMVICTDVLQISEQPDLICRALVKSACKRVLFSMPHSIKTDALPPRNPFFEGMSREGFTEFLGQFFRVLNSGDLNAREQTFAVEVEQLS
jgi:hypothetical protein